jgi:hypothetical protein
VQHFAVAGFNFAKVLGENLGQPLPRGVNRGRIVHG